MRCHSLRFGSVWCSSCRVEEACCVSSSPPHPSMVSALCNCFYQKSCENLREGERGQNKQRMMVFCSERYIYMVCIWGGVRMDGDVQGKLTKCGWIQWHEEVKSGSQTITTFMHIGKSAFTGLCSEVANEHTHTYIHLHSIFYIHIHACITNIQFFNFFHLPDSIFYSRA